jgi:hypothetical protein
MVSFSSTKRLCNGELNRVLVTHGPVIRRISLALYGISLIPLGNIHILGSVLGATAALARGVIFCLVFPVFACTHSVCISIFPSLGPSARDRALSEEQREAEVVQSLAFSRLTFYFAISGMATAMIILIANTEQMIHRSSNLVKSGEGDWTFGQTLALLLLFLPLWEVLRAILGMDDE